MAIAHVQTKQQAPTAATAGSSVTSVSETFASTPAVGNLVVVFLGHSGGGASTDKLTSVTDNQGGSNTWTIVRRAGPDTNGTNAAIAYSMLAVASGTFTVTANFSAAIFPTIAISEFSGVAASPADGGNSGSGSSTAPAGGSVTPSQAGDLFVSVGSDNSGASDTYTIPSGWDGKRGELNNGATFQTLYSASKIATDAAAQTSTWSTGVSHVWVVAIQAFKAAASGGPGIAISRGPRRARHPNPVYGFRSKRGIASGSTFTQSVAGTLTSGGALLRQTNTSKAGTMPSAGAILKQTATAKTGTLTSGGGLLKQTGKLAAGTLTSAGALTRQAGKALAGTLTSAGSLARQTGKALAGSMASAGALVKLTSKLLAGTLTSSGALGTVKVVLKALAGTLTSSGALTKQTGKVLTGGLTSAGALVRLTAHGLAGALTSAGAVVKQTARALAGTLSSSGALASAKAFLKALAGTLGTSGALTRSTLKSLGGALPSSGALARAISKGLAGALSSSGALTKRTSRALAGTLTSAGAIAKQARKALAGALSFSGVVALLATVGPAVRTAWRFTLTALQRARATLTGAQPRTAVTALQRARATVVGQQARPAVLAVQRARATLVALSPGGPALATKVTLPELPAGDDADIDVTCLRSDGVTPIDLTGAKLLKATLNCLPTPVVMVEGNGVTATDRPNGKITVSIPGTGTLGAQVGTATLDVVVVEASGKRTTIVLAQVPIVDHPTRA